MINVDVLLVKNQIYVCIFFQLGNVFMASGVVVLKHEKSTLRQSHNFISIDLKFGVDD